MLFRVTAVALALATSGAVTPSGLQAQTLDLNRRYQVLAYGHIDNLQTDLNKAGQSGIRVVTGSYTGTDEIAVLLEKPGDNKVYEYLVIAEQDAAKAEKRLGLAASQGYRLRPETITAKGKTFGGSQLVMILERTPGESATYSYLMLDTSLSSTLQVTLAGSVDQGYKVVAMVKRKDNYLVILEKKS